MAVVEAGLRRAFAVVGEPVSRVDAPAKVTGAARYVDDIPAPKAQFGRTVRSPVPHGVLRAIRLDPTFDWRGVTVATAADVPGRNCILFNIDDEPALVAIGDRVRYVAQPIALVAAPSPAAAAAAVAHVILDIDPLPPVFTVEESLRGDVEAHPDGNVLHEVKIESGDVDAAFAAADVVVEGTYRTGAAEHVYLEPQGMLAWWDGGKLHVTGSLQCPYFIHRALAAMFDLDAGAIDVAQATTGGGFGGKEEFPSTLAAHAALLARCAGRPVKMIYERGEDIASTTKRHPSTIHHRLAATQDGRLVAADVDVLLDAGAFVTLSPVVLLRSVLHATGPYRIPHVRIRGRAVATNHLPSGAFRGFGAPQAIFAAERQMAKLCHAIGGDPISVRKANALRPGDTTTTGGTLDDSAAGLLEVLDALETRLSTPPDHRRPSAGVSARRGRGIAVGFHGAGFTGNGEAVIRPSASIALAPDGTFRVLTSLVDMGQGARTVLAQLAADALGVDLALVEVPEPSTATMPDTGPTVASRTTLIGGSIVRRAAERLRGELRDWAVTLALDPDDIAAAARSRAGRAPAEPLSVTEEYVLPPNVVWDQDTLRGDAYPTYSWSAVAVDVAVDDDTSEVTVERCVQVVDAGRAINPQAVEGQIHGGTLQALGWALWEHVDRPGGAIPSPSLSTTIIPTAMDAPELEALIVEVPYAGGPLGAKGIGELPMDAPGAAAANAVADALDVPTDELPLLPEALHRLRGVRP